MNLCNNSLRKKKQRDTHTHTHSFRYFPLSVSHTDTHWLRLSPPCVWGIKLCISKGAQRTICAGANQRTHKHKWNLNCLCIITWLWHTLLAGSPEQRWDARAGNDVMLYHQHRRRCVEKHAASSVSVLTDTQQNTTAATVYYGLIVIFGLY